jgi:hypothetical protein
MQVFFVPEEQFSLAVCTSVQISHSITNQVFTKLAQPRVGRDASQSGTGFYFLLYTWCTGSNITTVYTCTQFTASTEQGYSVKRVVVLHTIRAAHSLY